MKPKDYQRWAKLKSNLHNKFLNFNGFSYREGEIYWACLGENVGWEEDGKGELFMRPVLILRGYSHRLIHVAPLTTQPKLKYSFPIMVNNKQCWALLSQVRALDTCRIIEHRPIHRISQATLKAIKRAFRNLFH